MIFKYVNCICDVIESHVVRNPWQFSGILFWIRLVRKSILAWLYKKSRWLIIYTFEDSFFNSFSRYHDNWKYHPHLKQEGVLLDACLLWHHLSCNVDPELQLWFLVLWQVREPLPLMVHHLPIAVTFAFIGSESTVVSTQVNGYFYHLTLHVHVSSLVSRLCTYTRLLTHHTLKKLLWEENWLLPWIQMAMFVQFKKLEEKASYRVLLCNACGSQPWRLLI